MKIVKIDVFKNIFEKLYFFFVIGYLVGKLCE